MDDPTHYCRSAIAGDKVEARSKRIRGAFLMKESIPGERGLSAARRLVRVKVGKVTQVPLELGIACYRGMLQLFHRDGLRLPK